MLWRIEPRLVRRHTTNRCHVGLTSLKALYLQALNQVRDFRWRHWCFTREYILKRTVHPTATGGSPIVLVSEVLVLRSSLIAHCCKWLPNQLLSVYDQMLDIEDKCGRLNECSTIMDLVKSQRETLRKEVRKHCAERSL